MPGLCPRNRRAGFSVIELLFALLILAVVGEGVVTLFHSNCFGATLSGDQSVAMSDTQAALRGIARDLCPAIGFTAPEHSGGLRVIYASGPEVEYYQDGATLKRMVASPGYPTSTVAAGLSDGSGLSLTYYDDSMSAIGGPMESIKYGQAAAVDVTITSTLSHPAFGQVIRTTRVVLRNKVS